MAESKNLSDKSKALDYGTGTLSVGGIYYNTEYTKMHINRKPYKAKDEKEIPAYIPGTVIEFFVKEGDKVEVGDKLLILQAMKMNNTITAPISGVIKEIRVEAGQRVAKNDLMIVFE
ncbi:MAG: biotin/lipoyl-containing protein [Bacteroidales bacterium]